MVSGVKELKIEFLKTKNSLRNSSSLLDPPHHWRSIPSENNNKCQPKVAEINL